MCRFIINLSSCENVLLEAAVQKLNFATKPHPAPYRLAWLKRGNEIFITRRVLVSFSIGNVYRDSVWCDVVPIDACHLLLGRPWQFDWSVCYDEQRNVYSSTLSGKKIVLLPSKDTHCASSAGDSSNLLSHSLFVREMLAEGVVLLLVGTEVTGVSAVPGAIKGAGLHPKLLSCCLNFRMCFQRIYQHILKKDVISNEYPVM